MHLLFPFSVVESETVGTYTRTLCGPDRVQFGLLQFSLRDVSETSVFSDAFFARNGWRN